MGAFSTLLTLVIKGFQGRPMWGTFCYFSFLADAYKFVLYRLLTTQASEAVGLEFCFYSRLPLIFFFYGLAPHPSPWALEIETGPSSHTHSLIDAKNSPN